MKCPHLKIFFCTTHINNLQICSVKDKNMQSKAKYHSKQFWGAGTGSRDFLQGAGPFRGN